MASSLGQKLLQSYQAIKAKYPVSQISNFIRQNPTPIGFVGKSIASPIQQGFNQIGQSVGNAIRGPISPLPNQGMQKITQPIRQFGGNLVQDYIQRFPGKVGSAVKVSPFGQFGQFAQGNIPTVRQQLGDIGNVGSLALDVATLPFGGGVVKNVAGQLGKQGLKMAVKEGAKAGAKFGGAYGGLESLFTGKDEQDIRKYLSDITMSTVAGAGIGGVAGGALGGVGYSAGKVLGKIKSLITRTPYVETQLRNLRGQWVEGNKPIKPNGMPNAQWDFQLRFNKKYGRNPYEPVFSEDLGKAVQIEAEKRVGLQVRPKSADIIPGKQPSTGGEIKVYHGTSAKFEPKDIREGVYVTPDKEYAGVYKSPSASSLTVSNEQVANRLSGKPRVLEYTMPKDAKIFDATNPKHLKLLDKYWRTESMSGEFLPTDTGQLEWTEVEGVANFLKKNGYKFDAIKVGEGGGITPEGNILRRADGYKILNPKVLKPPSSGGEIPKGVGGVKPIESKVQTEVPQIKPTENKNVRVARASAQVEQDLSQMSRIPPPTGGNKPPQNPPSGKTPSTTSIPDTFNINTKNLKLNQQEKATLKTSVDSVKPALEEIKGKTLSHDEVIKAAKTSDMLTTVVNRTDTLQAEAQILKARQQLVSLDKEVDAMQKSGNTAGMKQRMTELVNSMKVVVGTAADTGRKLESFKELAKDESLRQQILKEILKTNADTEKVIDSASKINWGNAREVVKFYREFIKPSITDVLTEYRYNNMLSNPRTHMRNALSNIIQTFVTQPATIAFQGNIKGTAQYYKGALTSFPDAIKAFMTSFRGEMMPTAKYEVTKMSTGKLPRFMTIPSRAMEAADKFFSTLIKSGEIARGVEEGVAKKTAEYSLFRSELFPEGQGKLLNAIDTFTNGLYKLRKVSGGDWFVPFLRTPMNVAKQWIEYSPAGLATLPGSANKKEQLAKTLIGSIVTAVGAKFAFDSATTWAAPTDPKQKQYFYDTGRKPFSVNINGNWVPMATFGVYAFALALPAAVKYFKDESRTALTDNEIEKLGRMIPGMLNFWSSQTPLSGLGGFVRTLQGDIDYSVAKNLGFTASQVIPFQALVRYISTAIDPIYRKTSGPIEQIQSSLPGVSKQLPPYMDTLGNLSKRNLSDYITPYSMGIQTNQMEPFYQARGNTLQQNAVVNKIKQSLEGGNQVTGSEKATYTIDGTDFEGYTSRDKFIYINEDGAVSTKSIKSIQKDQQTEEKGIIDANYSLLSDRLKRNNNVKDWLSSTVLYAQYLNDYKSKLDPQKDAKEIITIQNKIEDLRAQWEKYAGQGGFTKGKKPKKFISDAQLIAAYKKALEAAYSPAPKRNVKSISGIIKPVQLKHQVVRPLR